MKLFSLESFRYTVEPGNNIKLIMTCPLEPKAVHEMFEEKDVQ